MERVEGPLPKLKCLAVAITWLTALVLPAGAWADVGLTGIAARSGALLRWDSSTGVGLLQRGNNQIRFKSGLSWVLLNYRERIDTGPVARGPAGELLFSDHGATAIVAALESGPSRQPAAAVEAERPRIGAIILDAGHGGKDPGASHSFTVRGKRVTVVEKEVVLAVARQLFSDLHARYPHKRIIMTRTGDTYLSLEQRTEIANNLHLGPNEAMVFISIHANASFDPNAKGFEVWYLPPGYRREVLDPLSPAGRPQDLYPILNSMREEEYTIESVLLGRRILSSVAAEVDATNRGLKAQSWFVVRDAKMPAVLIELGFVTNQAEALHLADPSYLKKLASAIYNGVADFVGYFDNSSGFME